MSYLRRKATFFDLEVGIDQNRDVLPGHVLQYFNFQREPSLGRIKEDEEAGIIKFRMGIKDTLSPKKWDDDWYREPARNLNRYKLICNIYQAKDLIAGDDSGTSDPLVRIFYYGKLA